jgi:hypothetical protein
MLGLLAAAIAGIAAGFMFGGRDRPIQRAVPQPVEMLESQSSLAPSDNPADAPSSSEHPGSGKTRR